MKGHPVDLLTQLLASTQLYESTGENLFWPEAVTNIGKTAYGLVYCLSAETIAKLASEDVVVHEASLDNEVLQAISAVGEENFFPVSSEEVAQKAAWRLLVMEACLRIGQKRQMC